MNHKNNNITSELKNSVLEKISQGRLHMKPAWHFTLRSVLSVTTVLIVAMIVVYLLSFIIFALRSNGVIFAPQLGVHGVIFFIVSSPWMLIVLLGIFLLTLYLLVTHFAFSYTRPLIYTLIGIVLGVIALSSFIQYTTLHERFGQIARDRHIIGFGPMYERHTDRFREGITPGKIVSIEENKIIIETVVPQDKMMRPVPVKSLLVFITEDTTIEKSFEIGDMVLVFGPNDGTEISAFGIKSMPKQFDKRFDTHNQIKNQPR